MSRIAISGPANSGKTTRASLEAQLHPGAVVIRTDDYVEDFEWREQSERAAEDFDIPVDDLIIEGVTAIRALRRRMRAGQDPGIDTLVWLAKPRVAPTPEQQNMNRGLQTRLNEIRPWLEEHGVEIVEER